MGFVRNILVSVGMTLCVGALYAESKMESSDECPSFHTVSLGGNYTRASVKPHANSSFSGNIGGMQASYEFRPPHFLYPALKMSWRYGDTHGSDGTRTLLDIDIQPRLGYTFGIHSPKALITVFSGFAYRQIRNNLQPKDSRSVTFRYNEFYVPVGVLSDFRINDLFHAGFHLTWMPQVFPTVTISPLSGARWIVQETYKNFHIEAPITFSLDKQVRNLNVVLSPLFEFWQNGHSKAKTPSGTSLALPKNSYVFWGVNFNVTYTF